MGEKGNRIVCYVVRMCDRFKIIIYKLISMLMWKEEMFIRVKFKIKSYREFENVWGEVGSK